MHFSTLVIGEDVEGQLAPFSENLEVDPYWQEEDQKYIKSLFEKYVDMNEFPQISADMPMEAFAEFLSKHWGERNRYENGKFYYETTRNPKSEWDWWSVGGRYSNRLTNSDGLACDSATVGDLFSEQHRQRRTTYLASVWDEATAEDSPVRLLYNDFDDRFFMRLPNSRQAYIEDGLSVPVTCFALLNHGEWSDLGWQHDLEKEKGWQREISGLLESLPSETIITMVDCHI